ncbi:hypothetical protein [Schumannella sp. 10F1B-5-1]|uniref:hypothetical protein n=1 Tax=Schumannella sp. 10F1B-5-1 TaxID=2590780 RepID=UPI00113290C8|nr:hypothetical protein [Schumannella sp. 10F1B-5-1]TPW72256.1 hypothetical protein FJ658_08260 [Schumannella sp. 10F1B-5-1]
MPKRADPATVRLPPPWPFYAAGAIALALGVGSLIQLLLTSAAGDELSGLYRTVADDIPREAIPGCLLLVALAGIFTGELLRRASWRFREMRVLQGGASRVRIRRLPLGVVIAWAVVPVVIWAALVLWPVAAPPPRASEDFWFLTLFYGFIAGGVVGVFLISLLKRLLRRAGVAREKAPSAAWKTLSGSWRIEHWIGFLGAALVAVAPFAALPEDTGLMPVELAVIVAVLGALLLVVAGIVTAAGLRAGLDETIADSVV